MNYDDLIAKQRHAVNHHKAMIAMEEARIKSRWLDVAEAERILLGLQANAFVARMNALPALVEELEVDHA